MVFITFEGIEGSGKTTQVRLLAEALSRSGVSVETTREPGGTPLGDAIRKIFLNPEYSGMSVWVELFLVEAARVEHVAKIIRPALQAGKVVLCDRFTDSTLVYQGYARPQGILPSDFDFDLLSSRKGPVVTWSAGQIVTIADLVANEAARLELISTQGLVPDATILLDLEVGEGLRRASAEGDASGVPGGPFRAGASESRFEKERRVFHELVREGYLRLAERERDRIKVVDASGDSRSVHLRVIEALKGSKASAAVSRLEGAPCH